MNHIIDDVWYSAGLQDKQVVDTMGGHSITVDINGNHNIRKTSPCNTVYIAKLRYAGLYLFFLIFAPKHKLWVLFRTVSPRRF